MSVLQLNTANMRYVPEDRELFFGVEHGSISSFPKEIDVTSARTGAVVRFVVDSELAEQNEFWDGEMAVYRPVTKSCGIKNLSLAWVG